MTRAHAIGGIVGASVMLLVLAVAGLMQPVTSATQPARPADTAASVPRP